MQCQHLQEQAAKLQGEVMSLRSQLKDATSHTHQLEMAEAQMREEFERERAELERGQGSSERESVGLRRLLESTQQQLKKEVELRHQVEHDAAKTKKGLSLSLCGRMCVCVCVPFIYYFQSGTVWKHIHVHVHACHVVCVCGGGLHVQSLLLANLLLKEATFLAMPPQYCKYNFRANPVRVV